jgi:hypothetical protein
LLNKILGVKCEIKCHVYAAAVAAAAAKTAAARFFSIETTNTKQSYISFCFLFEAQLNQERVLVWFTFILFI